MKSLFGSSFPKCVGSLLLLLAAVQTTVAQERNDDSTLARAQEVLRSEIKGIIDQSGIPSISIVLMKDDQIVWAEAFGYANVRLKVPASPDSIYCVGSCFKPVTAMAVLQLADKGLLKLDDPVNPHLGDDAIKEFADQSEPITIRHLLSHFSGLPGGAEALPLWERAQPRTLQQIASNVRPENAAGKQYLYSNIGYAFAGLLVEKVSGQSYQRYVVENILKPVGVISSGPVNPTPEMIEQLALPYRTDDGRSVPERLHRLDVFPAGEIYLSAPDMGRILLTHLNEGKHDGDTILSKANIEEMRTPQFGGSDGLDFGIRNFEGSKLIMHGGGVPGYSSKFILDVDSTVGVYVVSNAGGAQRPMQLLAQLSIDLLNGRDVGKGLVRPIVGLGADLAIDEDTGLLRIMYVHPNSPAGDARLSDGTLISSINGVSVEGKDIAECLALLRGEAGASVQLETINSRSNETKTVALTRRKVLVPS